MITLIESLGSIAGVGVGVGTHSPNPLQGVEVYITNKLAGEDKQIGLEKGAKTAGGDMYGDPLTKGRDLRLSGPRLARDGGYESERRERVGGQSSHRSTATMCSRTIIRSSECIPFRTAPVDSISRWNLRLGVIPDTMKGWCCVKEGVGQRRNPVNTPPRSRGGRRWGYGGSLLWLVEAGGGGRGVEHCGV